MIPGQSQLPPHIKQERFDMLANIAKDLAGEICFPICLDVGMCAAAALRQPMADSEALARLVRIEPLLYLQLLHLANGPRYNPERIATLDLHEAISRIGLDNLRRTLTTLNTRQLLCLKDLASFGELASKLWQHSIATAAAASVLARHFTHIPPEEALLAGLIHDVGIFYLLFKANQNPELRNHPESLQYLIVQWHDSIGLSLAYALDLPERIAESIRDHDQPRPFVSIPHNLTEIVFVANILAGASYEWQRAEIPHAEQCRPEVIHPAYVALFPEIIALRKTLLSVTEA